MLYIVNNNNKKKEKKEKSYVTVINQLFSDKPAIL